MVIRVAQLKRGSVAYGPVYYGRLSVGPFLWRGQSVKKNELGYVRLDRHEQDPVFVQPREKTMRTGPNQQGVVRTHRLRPFQSIHTRTVDFALRRARIHLIPKVEQDRVRRQCEAAIGAEPNAGKITRIVEDIARKEVAAWLRENQKADAAISQKVQKADELYQEMLAPFKDRDDPFQANLPEREEPALDALATPEANSEPSGTEQDGPNFDGDYDPNLYRSAVRRAVNRAKAILRKGPNKKKDCEDLQQACDIEIWQVSKRKPMTPGLAYKISKDKVKEFLKEKIDETIIRICDADGNPVLNEVGLALGLDGAELKRRCEDESLSKAERKKAKDLLHGYQKTAPRLERFVGEDTAEIEDDDDYNPSTDAKLNRSINPHENENVLAHTIDTGDERRRLVESWHDEKCAIAEAVLTGNFTVQDYAKASGMAPATVGRIYAAVNRGFKSILKKVEKT